MSTKLHPEFEKRQREPLRLPANLHREIVREAIVARARELVDDPCYPTPAIIGQVADFFERHGVIPVDDETDA